MHSIHTWAGQTDAFKPASLCHSAKANVGRAL